MGSKISLSKRKNDELVASPAPLTQENDQSTAVVFGKPFLLRWEPQKSWKENFLNNSDTPPRSSRFWVADERTRECMIGEVAQTSLLTFHARNADAVNIKGSTAPLVPVSNETIVSIYANVGTGRYLTVGGVGLRFISAPNEIRTNQLIASSCEFLIRRCSVKKVGPLRFGEQVYLESVSTPNMFLSIRFSNGIGKLGLSKERCKFALHSPTLRELVQLHASATAHQGATEFSNLSPRKKDDFFPTSNDFELEESRLEAEREKQWMEAMAQRLPVELAKRVFQFKPDWTRTARLTCKAWQISAERNIKRIRVNGEFCSLDTPEERAALIEFVRRCPALEVLTLRNVMTLDDDDVAKITENRNLVRLVLGGCRRLSDKSTLQIADKLYKLNHLNMAFTSITDESLRICAERGDRIKELNLYNCSGVTVEGVNRTVHGLNSLEHINLRGTVVDSHLVQTFRKNRPHVVVLTGPASADSIWG